MARPFPLRALSMGRFRPSVHLYPPLVLLSCLVVSTAAPAVGSHSHDDLGTLEDLRELLVPGFGDSPEFLVGAGGIGLTNPASGLVVPPFQYSVPPYKVSLDGFVIPSGFFLARSGTATGGSLFRLTSPFSFRWAGTTSTPQVQLTWQAGTLFDNVFDGATGGFVPFRIVSGGTSQPGAGGSPSESVDLLIAAEPAGSTESELPPGDEPGGKDTADVFETALALLPPGDQTPPGTPPDGLPNDQTRTQFDDRPNNPSEGPDPASVPGPVPLAGVAIAFRCSRRLRQRFRQGR